MLKILQFIAIGFLVGLRASNIFAQELVVPGEVIVKLKHRNSPGQLTRELEQHGVKNITFAEALAPDFNIYLLKYDPQAIDGNRLINLLYSLPEIEAAQYNHLVEERELIPNDSLFSTQWALKSSTDKDIDAPDAWDITTGGLSATGDTIVIAVIDGGFDLNHEDLNFWKNKYEIQNNGIDDDLNGYIDDYHGWNGISQNADLSASSGHGTNVCGVAAARGNNFKGIAGVAWGTKILPIKGSTQDEAAAVRSYVYVYKMRDLYNKSNGDSGAFIVVTNSSFGINNGQPGNYPIWCSMYDSLGKVGILSVAATANAKINVDIMGDIPTACPSDYLITVTNTNSSDNIHTQAGDTMTAFGATTIDLGAPGYLITSTNLNNQYKTTNTGTSFSAPFVAGTVALLFAGACETFITTYKKTNPEMALSIKDALLEKVDTLPGFDAITVSGGRLNVNKALRDFRFKKCGLIDVVNSHDMVRKKSPGFYPNPTKAETVAAIFSGSRINNCTVTTYNLFGQVVKTIPEVEIREGANQIKINLNDLSPGIYFISLRKDNGIELINSKVVKE